MRTSRLILPALVLACALLPACGDDNPAAPPSQPSAYKNLTSEWHVLANIETAYNDRNIRKYDELLDDNFTFFLYHGDVWGDIPPSWDRATEVLYTSRLFDPNYAGDFQCKSITMDLLFDPNNVIWTDVTPDQNQYPGETWKAAVIYYSFRCDMVPDTQLESVAGARGRFTIRNAGTAQAPKWRLVEMDDLGDGTLVNYASAMGVPQESTWGEVKALYR